MKNGDVVICVEPVGKLKYGSEYQVTHEYLGNDAPRIFVRFRGNNEYGPWYKSRFITKMEQVRRTERIKRIL